MWIILMLLLNIVSISTACLVMGNLPTLFVGIVIGVIMMISMFIAFAKDAQA